MSWKAALKRRSSCDSLPQLSMRPGRSTKGPSTRQAHFHKRAVFAELEIRCVFKQSILLSQTRKWDCNRRATHSRVVAACPRTRACTPRALTAPACPACAALAWRSGPPGHKETTTTASRHTVSFLSVRLSTLQQFCLFLGVRIKPTHLETLLGLKLLQVLETVSATPRQTANHDR